MSINPGGILLSQESLLSPIELAKEIPLRNELAETLVEQRRVIRAILDGSDPRHLIITGPCSIHNYQEALEYGGRLARLSKRVQSSFVLIMRTYFEKARSKRGWKGFLYDPRLDGSHDMLLGLQQSRKLLVDLADQSVPCATEFLDPTTYLYLEDLISWGCVGARTAASQPHRQMVSALPMPVGVKNSTDGNVDIAICAVAAASDPHSFIGLNRAGQLCSQQTPGNPNAHVVLRGGANGPNYMPDSVNEALRRIYEGGIPPRVLIDCSHGNCDKDHKRQELAFTSAIQQILSGRKGIRGVMLESHLEEGAQAINSPNLLPGVSVTDPCIGWEETESMILWAHERLQGKSLVSRHSQHRPQIPRHDLHCGPNLALA